MSAPVDQLLETTAAPTSPADRSALAGERFEMTGFVLLAVAGSLATGLGMAQQALVSPEGLINVSALALPLAPIGAGLAWVAYTVGSAAAERRAIATPLPTLQAARQEIGRELNRARRTGRPVSVAVFHPRFAAVDPSEVGEQVLAAGIRELDIWSYDPLTRALVVVLPETDRMGANRLAHRLPSALPRFELEHAVGVLGEDGLTFDAVLEACWRQLHGRASVAASGESFEVEALPHAA